VITLVNDEAAECIRIAESYAENPEEWDWAADFYTQAGIILWEESREEAKLYFRKALILEPGNHRANRYLKHPPSDPDGIMADLPKPPRPSSSGSEEERHSEPRKAEDEDG
jgi:hypothetical protein